MKITDVTTILLTAPGQHIGMPDTQRSAAIVIITTDMGLTGLGEIYTGLYIAQAMPSFVDLYRPLLVGEDPFAIQKLWHRMYLRSMRWGLIGLSLQVMSGIENALWDLKGKALGVPVYELLGGLGQDRLRLYASAYACVWPPEKTADKVQHYADQGFSAVKLATGFWGRDISRETPIAQVVEEERLKVESIRARVGSSIDIALDHHAANNPNAWSADTAIQIISALDDYHLLWFEQPILPLNVDAHARLRAAVRTPIAGGEDATTLQEIKVYLEKEALDVLQPDVIWMGMMPTMQAFGMAKAYGVRATLHVAGTAVARAANYHLAFANENCFIVEYLVEQNPLFDELLIEPLDVRDGYLYPPTAPGFGVQLKEETIRNYAYKPREWRMTNQPGRAAQG